MNIGKTAIPSVIIAIATPVFAGETGTIAGMLGGAEGQWSTIEIEGAGATASYSDAFPNFTGVTLQGHKDAKFDFAQSLSISFALLADGSVQDPNVLYLPENSTAVYFQEFEGSVNVVIQDLTMEGDVMHISGVATGEIFHTVREGYSITVDEDTHMAIDLHFDARATPED